MKSLIILIALSLASGLTIAQSTSSFKVFPLDDSTFTRRTIISSLLSEGVKIKKVKTNFTRKHHAMGYFNDAKRLMGLSEGLALSTGVVDNIAKTNSSQNYTSAMIMAKDTSVLVEYSSFYHAEYGTAEVDYKAPPIKTEVKPYLPEVSKGDEDLSKEIGAVTYDARVLEITFVPTADTFCYRYVFASEEYDEFVGSVFNDAFAFYLINENGKKVNTAIVPKTKTAVSVNSINNGNPNNPKLKPKNAHLYHKFDGSQPLLFDGYTKVLDIRCKVKPGKTYTIKIVIADASDNVLDSVVLIEKESVFTYFKSFEIPYQNNQSAIIDSKPLAEVVETLKQYPSNKILVVGHASTLGESNNNLALSKSRCNDVVTYLLKNGITKDRIIEKAAGENMPRYDNDDLNRRVEVFIMGK